MAQARKRTVKVPTRTFVEETRYVLTLTEGEADFLQAVLASVGGDEKRSPRKYVHGIAKALAYVTGETFRDTDAGLLAIGEVRFDNYDKLEQRRQERACRYLLDRLPPRPGDGVIPLGYDGEYL